jgi:hypothetical protein
LIAVRKSEGRTGVSIGLNTDAASGTTFSRIRVKV